MFLQPSPND